MGTTINYMGSLFEHLGSQRTAPKIAKSGNPQKARREAQREKILRYLKMERKSLNQPEAGKLFSCGRLASRIEELRKQGHPISTTMEPWVDQFGEVTRLARYRYVG
jgi:DNA-binding PucR family transcriptional regulator